MLVGLPRTDRVLGARRLLVVLSYSLALLYGVFQLWLLASPTRTIRFRTVMTGFVCGAVVTFPLAVLLEWSWIRLAERVGGRPRFELVLWASWTVDPFIEELVRLAPLILVVTMVRQCRHQWSATDLVVLGAAVGAGYRWGEHLARFPGAPNPVWSEAFPDEQGWMLGGLDATKVEPPWVWVFDWIPEGVTTVDDGFTPALFQVYNTMLVWGTISGLAVALWVLSGRDGSAPRWLWRSGAVALVAFAGLSHAAVNAQARAGQWPLDVLAIPRAFEPLFWAWPLIVLATAMATDLIWAGRSEIDSSRFRVSETNESVALLRLALQQPVVSLPAVWGFIRFRRIVLNTTSGPAIDQPSGSTAADEVAAMADVLRSRLEGDTDLWDHIKWERAQIRRARILRFVSWPGILLLTSITVLGIFPVAYFIVGGTFRWGAIQNWFVDHPNLVIASAIGAAVLTIIVAGLVVARCSVIAETAGEVKARLVLGLLCQGFALVGLGLILYRFQTGNPLNGPLITNVFHGIEAMAALLLVAGLAALILATGIVALPAGAVLVGVTTTELAIGGVLMSASGLALLNYAHRGAYTQALDVAVDSIGDTIVQATDSGKNEPHGDAGRRLQQAEALIEELEAKLAELNRTQGSKARKRQLRRQIQNARRAAERAKKGETHGRRSKRQR